MECVQSTVNASTSIWGGILDVVRGASRHVSHISIGFAITHSNEDLAERAYTRVYG